MSDNPTKSAAAPAPQGAALAPCKHCGGKAALESGTAEYDKPLESQLFYAGIGCTNLATCGVQVSVRMTNQDAAIDAARRRWNRRATPLPTAEAESKLAICERMCLGHAERLKLEGAENWFVKYETAHYLAAQIRSLNMRTAAIPTADHEAVAREIVKYVSDAALELAFTRHDLTTTEYEDTEYADIEEGVEAFTVLSCCSRRARG